MAESSVSVQLPERHTARFARHGSSAHDTAFP
jgi:hypothetical protein